MSHLDAGWAVAGVLISLIIGAIVQRYLLTQRCETCGMKNLESEISRLKNELATQIATHSREVKRLCLLVRALAQRAGMTVEEQAELEALEK